MATLTSNGSFSSLSISGSGTKRGNITWTPPTLPDGASIQSITLTANLSVSMTRGSVTVTINGKTYNSSTSLSIDLGTSLTSSLSVSAKGSSFLAKGTVSISNIIYTVNYVILNKYNISASASSNGSISPSGEIEVYEGYSKTFSITPNTGYKIDDVLVDGRSVGAITSYTFSNISGNHTISATFSIKTYTITSSSDSNGNISPSGNTTLNHGSSQTYTITPNIGYKVSDVLVDGISVGAVTSYTFSNVTSNHTLHVDFSKKTYNISTVIIGNGTITYSKDSPYEYGDTITCTFNPDSGYAISKIIIDGNSINNISSYTFENISDNHNIEITFEKPINFKPNNTSDLINIYPNDSITIFSGHSNYLLASTESENVKEIKFIDEENNRYSMHKYNSDIINWGTPAVKDGFGKGVVSYRSDGKPPVLSTTKSKFGGKSLYFDNINNSPCMLKINTPALHSETFTISFWVNFDEYYNSSSESEKILELDNNIVIQPHNRSGTWYMTFWICNDVDNASYIIINNSNLSLNTWYNFTLCRNVDTYYFFINGNLCYSKSYSNMPKLSTLKLFIEESETLSYYSQQPSGYLDELMICDSCLYTSNYTVKSSEWTENELRGNYMVLHCNEEISVNTTSYNNSIINNITYKGNLYAYNDSTLFTNRNNIYIDNSKKKGCFDIDLKQDLDSFTIGFWYRKEADDGGSYSCLLSIRDEINNKYISLYNPHPSWSSSNLVIVRYDGGYSGGTCNNAKFTVGKWHYITLCKIDTTFKLYIDGIYDRDFTFNSSTVNKLRFGSMDTGDINCSSSYGDIYVSSECIYNNSNITSYPYPTQPFNTLYSYEWSTLDSDTNIDVYPMLNNVNPFYIKSNGVWKSPTAYIKQNGTWILQDDVSSLFNENTKFAFKGHIT